MIRLSTILFLLLPTFAWASYTVQCNLVAVEDGDTIVVEWPGKSRYVWVRLINVGAPESYEPGFHEATRFHESFYQGVNAPVILSFAKHTGPFHERGKKYEAPFTDRYGRALAHVVTPNRDGEWVHVNVALRRAGYTNQGR